MWLYDLDVSGNCYKIRLLCALLGVKLEMRPVDFMAGEHKGPELTALNPLGELPILVDGDLVLRDSQAILVYIARRHGGDAWLPSDAAGEARVVQWLSTAANDIARGPNDARLHDKFGYKLDPALARSKAARVLGLLDAHLKDRDWLELGHPTIADIACFAYVGVAPEGGIDLKPYPNVCAWMRRIRALPGFIPMPGQFAD